MSGTLDKLTRHLSADLLAALSGKWSADERLVFLRAVRAYETADNGSQTVSIARSEVTARTVCLRGSGGQHLASFRICRPSMAAMLRSDTAPIALRRIRS